MVTERVVGTDLWTIINQIRDLTQDAEEFEFDNEEFVTRLIDIQNDLINYHNRMRRYAKDLGLYNL